MAQKKKPVKRRAGKGDRDLRQALERARRFMENRQLAEARRLLERLVDSHPQHPEVFRMLAEVASAVEDHRLLLFACDRLQALAPRDPELPFALAVAYLSNGMLALAVATSRKALAAHPGARHAEMARAMIDRFGPELAEMLVLHKFDGPDGLECLVLHDRIRAYIAEGKFGKAHVAAEQLIARQPRFAPAYNNGADASFHDGNLAAALALTERVLAFEPANVFALSNLVRYKAISGKLAEARQDGERLRELDTTSCNWAVKQAEALSWIGDDAGVLAVFARAERLEPGAEPPERALLHHLAAVARLHQGDERAARAHFQAALRAAPGFAPAQGNLDDLKQPVGKRHAPWVSEFTALLPKKLLGDLIAQMQSPRGGTADDAVARAKSYAAMHPELEGLVPLLLKYTDAPGRELALRLATLLRTPAMLEAARDFALGQLGPDALRIKAANLASEGGLFADGMATLSIEGTWRSCGMQRYEIHGEPVARNHAPGVFAPLEEGVSALRAGNAKAAEASLRRALAIDADDPVVLNNLAGALAQLGRLAETEAIAERLVERHPDYLFGRTALASISAQRGELARAHELLAPLLSRRRFHHNELSALSLAQVNLYLAENNRQSARVWLDLLRQADPHHPALAGFARILAG